MVALLSVLLWVAVHQESLPRSLEPLRWRTLGRVAVLSVQLSDFVLWSILAFSAVYANLYPEKATMPLVAR